MEGRLQANYCTSPNFKFGSDDIISLQLRPRLEKRTYNLSTHTPIATIIRHKLIRFAEQGQRLFDKPAVCSCVCFFAVKTNG